MKWPIIGQMTIVMTLRGFNNLGRSVTPIFSFDGPFSLPIFYVLQKNEQNLWSRSLNVFQNAPSNSIHLTSLFSCASVSNASLRVKVSENDGNIWNYWHHRFTSTKYYSIYRVEHFSLTDYFPLILYGLDLKDAIFIIVAL